MNNLQMAWSSKIGTLYLVASPEGLQGVFWQAQNVPYLHEKPQDSEAEGWLLQAVAQLEEYLAGERETFDMTLDIVGTDFQKEVWLELLKIPYGHTLSYKELAEKLGRPKAYRAVGTANGRNPLSLIIPCHRVIAADATLGGYAGGLERKALLLNLERSKILIFQSGHEAMPTPLN